MSLVQEMKEYKVDNERKSGDHKSGNVENNIRMLGKLMNKQIQPIRK